MAVSNRTQPRMEDIAERLRVSITTVRRAFLKNEGIQPGTLVRKSRQIMFSILFLTVIFISGGCNEQLKMNTAGGNPDIIELPVHFYRMYPINYQAKYPSDAMLGWGSDTINLDINKTALIVMHTWNLGLDDKLPWPPKERCLEKQMQSTEWVKRYRKDVKQIEEILNFARKHNMNICHIAGLEHYAEDYPAYRQNKAQAGPEPVRPEGAFHGTTWHEDWLNRIYGQGFYKQMKELHRRLDFASNVRPASGEGVCVTSHQLNHWLRKRGINNLIYTGFAINMCLWFSPCGMSDMMRYNYRSLCIEECVTTVEYKETAYELRNKESAMWRVSLMFGYVLKKDEFMSAVMR